MARLVALFLVVLLAERALVAQRIELIDDAKLPRFEVVSVKPGNPSGGPPRIDVPPGRFVQENVPLYVLVNLAFDLRPGQVVRPVPDLVTRELFTIDARMPVNTQDTNVRLMLRSLLIDRFKLRFHVESREQDGYALTVASREGTLGRQLRPSRVDCPARGEAQRRNEPVPPLPEGKSCRANVGTGRLEAIGMPPSFVTTILAGELRRPVVDKTGLTGTFDLEMQWSPASALLTTGPDAVPPPSDGPSIFTAVQEQLGLRLQSSKTSVDFLVIDRIERPEPD